MISLAKKPGRDFIVLNLSDPQLGNGEWESGHRNRRILTETVDILLERVRPDLITVSGDLSWAGDDDAYDAFAAFLESKNIPWTVVWGNHDNQNGPETVERVVTRYLTLPHFLYERGPTEIGNGNFVIRIEEDGKPVEGLIMMDSHDRAPYTAPDGNTTEAWAKLTPPQLAWYREQIAALEEAGCHDSTIITHIPIYAYREASAAAFRAGFDKKAVEPQHSQASYGWNHGYESSFGVEWEGISSYPADEGALDAILESGSTKHVLVGHDHVNNTVIAWRGVILAFSLKAGPGCYWDPRLNGGTVLTVTSDGMAGFRHEYVDPTPWLA